MSKPCVSGYDSSLCRNWQWRVSDGQERTEELTGRRWRCLWQSPTFFNHLLSKLSDVINTIIGCCHNSSETALNKTCSTETHRPGGQVNSLLVIPTLYFRVDYCCMKQSHSVTTVINQKRDFTAHLNYPALINLEESPIALQHSCLWV